MHGYGYPPERLPSRPPSSGVLVGLRVFFVALTVLSCGFLAWGAMLRLACVTRRKRDWWLFAVVLLFTTGWFAYIGESPDEEVSDQQAVALVLSLGAVIVGVVSYYLYAEVRHYRRAASGLPYGPGGVPQAPPGYASPGTATGPGLGHAYPPAVPQPGPYHRTPPPAGPQPAPDNGSRPPVVPRPSAPYDETGTPAPTAPGPVPPPVGPPPVSSQRIDQVKAELDELSEYLRKEGGGR
ncbi:hypothetical protein [uncultured Streptomyces sp.]|uniref:hypothetical protein n=1 Tax=uncultured Streptomyces sp. TaxID=174707 RepID=UPI00260A54FD|nr:hypothetical protein [uncultured Streptomyces sp.]